MIGSWGYRSYREHLAERFPGERIRKLCLHAGFTCPNLDGTRGAGGCAYCDNAAFSPPAGPGAVPGLAGQWDRGRAALRRRHGAVDGFIAYFQAFSNTYAPVDQLRRLYQGVAARLPECVGVSLGTRPDCLAPPVVDLLAEVARETFLTVEIGLQSDRDDVLQRMNRGHNVATFRDAIARTDGRGFERCVHVMLGLPGEGVDAPERLGDLLAGLAVESVKIHNLHIVRGTAWHRAWAAGAVAAPGQGHHLDAVQRLLARLRPDQAVQRLVADAPDRLLVSDHWCQDKRAVLADLAQRLTARAVNGPTKPPGKREPSLKITTTKAIA